MEGECMMPKRRPKDIGTAAETAVVRWLQANGWPHAERRALRGNQDAGDITGTPCICWEVKAGQAAIGASDGQINAWLIETANQRVAARADYGILIQRRKGKSSAGDWWAWLRLGALVTLADIALSADPRVHQYKADNTTGQAAARLRLADLATILHRAGYGEAS